MEYFSFKTTAKYIKALLDTFNDIQVEKYIDKTHKKLVTVPIAFASKDAASVFSQTETEQLLAGNNNILPRMSLSLIDTEKDDPKATARFHTPIVIKDPAGNKITFQHNCVPYAFGFTLQVAARSLTDLTAIIEQILPFFNPSIVLRIRELEWLSEPTSIQVDLMSINYDLPDEYDSSEVRIVTADIMMKLHGNIYPPLKNSALIKSVKYYLSPVVDFVVEKDKKELVHKFDVDENTLTMIPSTFTRIDYGEQWNTEAPKILGIKEETPAKVNEAGLFRILYEDDTDDRIQFIINVISEDVKPIISKQLNYFYVTAEKAGTIKISIQAINSYDVQSNVFEYDIIVKEQ